MCWIENIIWLVDTGMPTLLGSKIFIINRSFHKILYNLIVKSPKWRVKTIKTEILKIYYKWPLLKFYDIELKIIV